jgi:hypothetical protein
MRTNEVMQVLDIREFTSLCSLIDEFGPKKAMAYRHGSGTDIQTCNGILEAKKFRVLSVVRHKLKLLVLVEHAAFQFNNVKRCVYEVKPSNA